MEVVSPESSLEYLAGGIGAIQVRIGICLGNILGDVLEEPKLTYLFKSLSFLVRIVPGWETGSAADPLPVERGWLG